MNQTQIKLQNCEKQQKFSQNLYGIFYEDINFSCDGGINANMVNNYSFDGIYFDSDSLKEVPDYLRYWPTNGNGAISSGDVSPLNSNSKYAVIDSNGNFVLSNLGYNGQKKHKEACAMSIEQDTSYQFEAYIRPESYSGKITIQVVGDKNRPLTDLKEIYFNPQNEWEKVEVELLGIDTGYGKLQVIFVDSGIVHLDCVSLYNKDYWNSADSKWSYGKLRKDLIQSLADLSPKFMRFPGGCIVEGRIEGNQYRWKETVGELYERKSKFSLWASEVGDGGYNQSYQIGFYEYFLLCEDLKMKPLPTLPAGLNCQMRCLEHGHPEAAVYTSVDSDEFKTDVVGDYLDLIEFANGDPEKNEWAALRAKMGHPEPFGLDRIGVGNENYGKEYTDRAEVIINAIHEKYPEILCVISAGVHPYHEDNPVLPGLDEMYNFANKFTNVAVDEHSYHTPEWFESETTRFDNYDRKGAKVYFGEYAANGMLGPVEKVLNQLPDLIASGMAEEFFASGEISKLLSNLSDPLAGDVKSSSQTNEFDTALGEAAFLVGVERNSDIVEMASYAPLFNLIDSEQWNHNLIDFNPKTVCLTANYFVQQLFSANIGENYLPFDGALPERNYCSITGDASTLFLKYVNCSSEDTEVIFNLEGSVENIVGTKLQNNDLSARNSLGWDDTEAVYNVCPSTLDNIKEGDGNISFVAEAKGIYLLEISI